MPPQAAPMPRQNVMVSLSFSKMKIDPRIALKSGKCVIETIEELKIWTPTDYVSVAQRTPQEGLDKSLEIDPSLQEPTTSSYKIQ